MRLLKLVSFFFLSFAASVLANDIATLSDDKNLKIITLSPHSVEILFALGVGDKIISTIDYSDYPTEALNIPRIGNYAGIQIERIVQLNPDLIIGWKSGNRAQDLNKLESLDLNIIYSQPNSFSELISDIKRIGLAVGKEDSANSLSAKLSQSYKAIKMTYKASRKVRVFYQLWHDPLRTVGGNNWINQMISDCGGENIFRESSTPYPVTNLETVVVNDPEVIVIPHHSGDTGAKTEFWKSWSGLNAVKNNRVYIIDGDLLHRFSPRAIEGLSQLCKKIHIAR